MLEYSAVDVKTDAGTSADFLTQGAGAISGGALTLARSINDKGAVTGFYYEGNGHAFVRAPKGKLKRFDPPHAISSLGASINGNGVITGYYTDHHYKEHGFIRTP